MNMITVTSRRGNQVFTGEYIGRPNPLGNPFVIGRDGTREKVIALYHNWLTDLWNIGDNNAQRIELFRLADIAKIRDLYLVCWCAPKACHGDIIKQFIELINKEKP